MTERCHQKWWTAAASHVHPVPYLMYATGPSTTMRAALRGNSDWDAQRELRGFCSFRAQVLPLAIQNGAPAKGRGGRCIFCGRKAPAPVHHVVGECTRWAEHRPRAGPAGNEQAQDTINTILAHVLQIEGVRNAEGRKFLAAIDEAAREFWRSKNGFWG